MSQIKGSNNSSLIKFIKEHPFQCGAVSASMSVFNCSCIGFFREYLVLKEFGINVVSYAELNDFLVAGLKDPYVLAIFPLFIVFGAFWYFYSKRFTVLSTKFKSINAVILSYPVLLTLLYIPYFSVAETVYKVKSSGNPVTVTLRNQKIISNANLISITEKFIFVWSSTEKKPIVLTTSNVISISYN